MKRQVSLKWFILLSFLTLMIVLIVGYSLLSAHFFVLGMDNIIASNMAQVVKSYVAAVPEGRRNSLQSFSGYRISRQWEQMPLDIRNAVKMPTSSGILIKHNVSGWFSPPDRVYFVMRVVQDGSPYFISHLVTRNETIPLIGRNAARSRHLLLSVSLFIMVILATIVLLFFKRISRPINALGEWARRLTPAALDRMPPDFFYPELNELALLIKNSLSSVQAGLEREHRFLRHSSHELRTPIGVIRNNIELLNRIQQDNDSPFNCRQKQILDRIDRASLTMKHMTETLLWLSRESEADLPAKRLDLETLVREVVAETQYLLKNKEVDLHVATCKAVVTVAEIPARIVLSNLVRNAFQHTWQGEIRITQTEGRITIENDAEAADESNQDLGFGLGLQLTEQLTNKLKWPCSSGYSSGKYCVEVDFS